MRPDGLIKQLRLAVDIPSLKDTASDWDRIQKPLLPLLDGRPLQASLASLRDLGAALRGGEWQVVATLADVGDAWRLVRVNPAPQISPALGLAIDLGTTTVAAELVEVETGTTLASCLTYNAQRQFGADVTSRMMHAEKLGGLAELRQAVLHTLNELVADLCAETKCTSDSIDGVVIAGNTIMMHLLLGIDPSSIRRDPYVPATTVFPILTAVEVGLNVHPGAPLYLFPAASGYVGGDVTAGLLATGIADREALSILVDIGTNGETVLGNRDFILACSGSAGSAFEGCGLEWGMSAQPGAIAHVWIENSRLRYRTVAGEPPRGICGSGLIEVLGAFLQADVINRNGKVNLTAPYTRRGETYPEVILAPAGETAVGRDIALRQAVRIGLLPDIPRERIRFIGNSSLAGARATLLSRQAWQRAQEIASSITCLELTAEPRYFEEYTAALFLPHTDLSLFPSLN